MNTTDISYGVTFVYPEIRTSVKYDRRDPPEGRQIKSLYQISQRTLSKNNLFR